ncbi:TonB family protein [Brevundimonas sp.]|uniref:TonB family protein n=1 Tax=Brevundimonas sp. TaxID=1871086 RepID=UPI003D0B5EAD
MGTPELLALSLGLSLLLAGAAYGLVRLFEASTPDPVLRETAWAMALYLPALPIVLVGAALLLPPPTFATPIELEGPAVAPAMIEIIVQQGAAVGPIGEPLAFGVFALAGLLAVIRVIWLARRTVRLHRLIRASGEASPAIRRIVEDTAGRLGAPTPDVRIRAAGGEALIAGLLRPVLVLPASLLEAPDPQALRAVCAHELAHLKRGDHRALWIEEALLAVLAFNPILRIIRDHRSAAREEACDAAALAQAGEDVRRLYARSLLDALRASPKGDDAPALTFTSSRRILVMRRLKAILSPVPTSGIRQRLTVLGLGVAVAAVAGTSSLALAVQREAVAAPPPVSVVTASRPAPAPRAVATPTRVTPSVAPKAIVAPASNAEPAPRAAPVPVAQIQPRVITNPSWVQHPMPSYPAAALEQGLTSGQADLSCTVEADGHVSACTVVNENPVGAGYGAAAVAAAGSARLSPRSVDGAGVGGTVRFSVRFTIRAE